jgi:hypothetical protein
LKSIIGPLPEPAATAFAVAGFMGLRQGELQGLLWENYQNGEITARYMFPVPFGMAE